MIHTSYFANIKKLPKHLTPISISRFPPKWYEGEKDLTLAPSEELLIGFKEEKISKEEVEEVEDATIVTDENSETATDESSTDESEDSSDEPNEIID